MSYLHNLLRKLKPTGDTGLEGLARQLLRRWTGLPLFLRASGTQDGRDFDTADEGDVRAAAEVKRYKETTALKKDTLIADIHQAATTMPDLELWVLFASRSISGQTRTALANVASHYGIDSVVIDAAHTADRVGVLCARYPEIALDQRLIQVSQVHKI